MMILLLTLCLTQLTLLKNHQSEMGLIVVHIFSIWQDSNMQSNTWQWPKRRDTEIIHDPSFSVKDSFYNLRLITLHLRSELFSLRKVRSSQIFLGQVRVVLRQVTCLQQGMPESCTGEKDAALPKLFELVSLLPSLIVNIPFHYGRLQKDIGLHQGKNSPVLQNESLCPALILVSTMLYCECLFARRHHFSLIPQNRTKNVSSQSK